MGIQCFLKLNSTQLWIVDQIKKVDRTYFADSDKSLTLQGSFYSVKALYEASYETSQMFCFEDTAF